MEETITQTGYMLLKLDKISDQLHGLEKLLSQPQPARAGQNGATKAKRGLYSRIVSLPPFWQSMVAGGLFWIIGICTRAYLSRGGDPMALIDLVLKHAL